MAALCTGPVGRDHGFPVEDPRAYQQVMTTGSELRLWHRRIRYPPGIGGRRGGHRPPYVAGESFVKTFGEYYRDLIHKISTVSKCPCVQSSEWIVEMCCGDTLVTETITVPPAWERASQKRSSSRIMPPIKKGSSMTMLVSYVNQAAVALGTRVPVEVAIAVPTWTSCKETPRPPFIGDICGHRPCCEEEICTSIRLQRESKCRMRLARSTRLGCAQLQRASRWDIIS